MLGISINFAVIRGHRSKKGWIKGGSKSCMTMYPGFCVLMNYMPEKSYPCGGGYASSCLEYVVNGWLFMARVLMAAML